MKEGLTRKLVTLCFIMLKICATVSGHEDKRKILQELSDIKAKLAADESVIKVLEENVKNLQSLLYMAQTDMLKGFELLSEQVTAPEKLKVAFYARVETSYENIEPWATIVFAQTETNIGNAYNNVSGEFKAPITGTYVFYSNILSAPDKIVETALQVNEATKLNLYSGGKYHGSGSNMAVLRLKKGDVVKMVKAGPWGTKPFYIHHAWSTFSGYLLQADMYDPPTQRN